jgi:uncharacterized membrane protein required for colicin V production
MIDFLLGGLIVVLLVRGWFRGLIRQALDLAVLVIGLFLALRLSGPVGGVVGGLFGSSPRVSRLAGGAVVFVAVAVAAALASHVSHRTIKALPGLPTLNRLGGAALGGAWGLFIVTVALTLVAVVPVPSTLARQLDDSAVSAALTDPDGVPQRVLEELSGDRVVRTLIELRRRFDSGEVVVEGEERIGIPAAAPDEVASDPGAAEGLFTMVNEARVRAGRDPVAWSPLLAGVALAHATDMYTRGYLGHRGPDGAGVDDRAGAAGAAILGENIALGATAADVHERLVDGDTTRAAILGPGYRWAGVAVVSGPLGLLAVEVFSD